MIQLMARVTPKHDGGPVQLRGKATAAMGLGCQEQLPMGEVLLEGLVQVVGVGHSRAAIWDWGHPNVLVHIAAIQASLKPICQNCSEAYLGENPEKTQEVLALHCEEAGKNFLRTLARGVQSIWKRSYILAWTCTPWERTVSEGLLYQSFTEPAMARRARYKISK